MVRLLALCLASLAATSSVLGKRLKDGDYHISIPGPVGALYLTMPGPNDYANFEPAPILGTPPVWNVNSDADPFSGTERRIVTTINGEEVRLGYAGAGPGTKLRGSQEEDFDVFNLRGETDETEENYFVFPNFSRDVAVSGDNQLLDLNLLSVPAYLRDMKASPPPLVLTFTKVPAEGA